MRQKHIVAGAALASAIVALLGAYMITVDGLRAAPQPPPIDILQMMRDAKGLLVEQFDAI